MVIKKTEPHSSWRYMGGNGHKAQQEKLYLDIKKIFPSETSDKRVRKARGRVTSLGQPSREKKSLKIWYQGSANGLSRAPRQIWICAKTHLMVWVRGRGESITQPKRCYGVPCLGHSSTWMSAAWLGSRLGKAAHGS